ncbi:MAG: phosphatase PAP2 family protein [Saprospiraceae bacterium]|uniref:Phosphatase PAP2 family protein n=1 Tax=Candidatus Opimibacter skivensis TaxID=2982028 RepID=A0A9D7XUQ3_9BACT|nr:phosphatase PAP2 family protein [Candidatus Opimibacter skivensis]
MLTIIKKYAFIFILLLAVSNAFSQKTSSNFYKTDSLFSFQSPKGYVPSLLHNFGEQITAPIHFKAKQWLITGSAIGVTAILIHQDNEINRWGRGLKEDHQWINKSSPVITKFGAQYGALTVGTFGLVSAVFKNEKGVRTSLLATQSMITTGVWIQIIKQVTGRERPNASYYNTKSGGGSWYGPFASFDKSLSLKYPGSAFNSFASGHTAIAFSIATVFASQYNHTPVIPILSYTAATMVGLSRLTENKHWSSDVFVGALLGYLCGKQVVRHYKKLNEVSLNSMLLEQNPKSHLSIIQDGHQVGIALQW